MGEGATLWCGPIRHRGLQELVLAASALPRAIEESPPSDAEDRVWPDFSFALAEPRGKSNEAGKSWRSGAEAAPSSDARLREMVGGCLTAMERLVDEHLTVALSTASQAWDGVDGALAVLGRAPFAEAFDDTLVRLRAAAHGRQGSARAVAIEGILALELAAELVHLFERRLSSLIRLRARAGHRGVAGLLPGGRPFLDLAAALHDAARAWS